MRKPLHRPATATAAGVTLALLCVGGAGAVTLLDGFQEEVVFSGLNRPMAIRFAPDGRVFVAEKAGVVKVFDGVADDTPDVLVDVGNAVHDFWDRGLVGLALDPDFSNQPYVYLFYTYNFDPTDPAAGMPRWPDSCPDPPGATSNGCVVNGRLSRVQVATDNSPVGGEQVLVENRWCQQYPSHSVGDLVFSDHERVLYASAGDGASFNWVDYGQGGGNVTPTNPCGDPDTGVGGDQQPPTAEGGALRSQDLRSPGDPVDYSGTVLALDPDTGGAAPTNPLLGGDPDDDAIIAHGLRNPYRMTYRPGTHELWIGDVGWSTWEEINRIGDTEDGLVENFGWPCYEGDARQGGYDGADLAICEQLYTDTAAPATAPFYAYRHGQDVDPDPIPFGCSKNGSSSVSGLAFYSGGPYPFAYDGALFFSDYSRDCLFVIFPDGNGDPDPSTRAAFVDAASNPVDLQVGPDGLLYYVDIDAGRVIRLLYFSTNRPPQAVATANPPNGPAPLNVQLDASSSVDPDPNPILTYAWDLDGDGQYNDSTAVDPTWAFPTQGRFPVSLRVTDEELAEGTDQILITAGNTAPVATILSPLSTDTWQVGQSISFQGSGSDPEDGAIPAAAMHWDVRIYHCPDGVTCHIHFLESFDGVDQGSFTAPDHEWYSYLEIELTVTDSGFPGGGGGQLATAATVAIDPRTVDLSFDSIPSGLELSVSGVDEPTPFSRTVIVGSTNSISAPTSQNLAGRAYTLASWSDGGSAAHAVVPATPLSLVATYEDAGLATDWWDAAWGLRVALSIDNATGGALTDVPLLVVLDASRVAYSWTRDQGEDLRFVSSDGTTLLAHEIESWDEAGSSYVWVRVAQIDATSDQGFFWLYYGNPAATDGQSPGAVWSAGYHGVWHLHGDLLDASGTGNDGTDHGSSPVDGAIGGGRQLDGLSWIDVGNHVSLDLVGQGSIEAWIRLDDPDLDAFTRIVSKKAGWSSANGYNLEYNPGQNLLTNLTGGSDFGRAETIDLDNSWHHVAAVMSGTTCRLYVDGADVTTDSICGAVAADSQPLNIGRAGGGGSHFLGVLDEVRVSGIARSAEWIDAQYRSMSNALLTWLPIEVNCEADEPPVPGNHSTIAFGRAGLSWSSLPGASGYELVRGALSPLRSGAGDFSQAVVECLLHDTQLTTLSYTAAPPVGEAFWFLVQGSNCAGNGGYDSGGPGQQASRDPGIGASPAACP